MADDKGTDPTIPYQNPVARFEQLPKYTRELLEALDKEDCATLIEVLKSYQRAAAIGWFIKWLFLGMVGAFMASITLAEGIRKALAWVTGKGV